MIENYDFIQLPPIKKDTPSEVVSMIWQYLKLPEESRKRVKADLIDVHENCGKEVLIGLGIISATFLGTTGIVCFAGGELSIGNGTFKISRLEKSTA